MNRSVLAWSAVAVTAVASAGLWTLPQVSAAPAASMSAAAMYQIDPVHSSLLFKIKHSDVAWFYGRFNEFSGSYSIDPEAPESGSVTIAVKAESVDTGNKKRDDHLRSQDFFSAKEFESINFKSTSVRHEEGNTFQVTGDLTLHGVTKQITVPVEFTGKAQGRQGELSGIHATFTIKRSDYGMNFMIGRGLGDEVMLIVSLEGKGS